MSNSHPGDSGDDPGRPQGAEAAAGAALRRAWLKSALWHGALLLVPTLLAAGVAVLVVLAAFQSLGDLSGGLWWLAVLYLVALAVGMIVSAARNARVLHTHIHRHDDHNEHDHDDHHEDDHDRDEDDEDVCGCGCERGAEPESMWSEFDSHASWRARACSAPAALLGAVHLSAAGWPDLLAAVTALLGWLGIDLAIALTDTARIRVRHALALINTEPRGTPEL